MKNDSCANEQLPSPLVPAEVDLRDFQFMPLDVGRLLSSETWIEAADDPRLGHALLSLWAGSWHQLPAGSLPDIDTVLYRLSMCPSRKEWQRIKDRALRGWVKCNDGLLYHPVVAEKALEAWERRSAFKEAEANKITRQKRWRDRCRELTEILRNIGITPPRGASLETLEKMVAQSAGDANKASHETSVETPARRDVDVSRDAVETPARRDVDVSRDAVETPARRCRDAVEIGKTGTGKRQGQGKDRDRVLDLAVDTQSQPRVTSKSAGDSLGECPHQEILALYRELLPMLTVPRIWDEARQKALRHQWKTLAKVNGISKGYASREDGLAFWAKYFKFVANDTTLPTGYERTNGTRWYPDLPWLIKPENLKKVAEGNYAKT